VRQHLNTLFVTTQGAYLSREGETVLVRVEQETKLKVPIHTLGSIVCFGQVMCSPPLMGLCGERNVLISFHSEHGKFLGRVQGPVSGNVLLRRAQYRWADDAAVTASSPARWRTAGRFCREQCATIPTARVPQR
jgi:CRISPR-associated protein Cas1